jgi:hypothetical protein
LLHLLQGTGWWEVSWLCHDFMIATGNQNSHIPTKNPILYFQKKCQNTNQLTNYMKQSPSCEARSSSASKQKFPAF